jgi:hypothetical protein
MARECGAAKAHERGQRAAVEHDPACDVFLFEQLAAMVRATIGAMTNVALDQFIDQNAAELLRRCEVKVAARAGPPATEAQSRGGVPLFLAQLSAELRHGPTNIDEITESAMRHGRDLLLRGFNISQVVHGYGDVCQAITDLAVDTQAPISIDDFRTLNRCLDDAIAGAVTEFSRPDDVTRGGESQDLRDLLTTAKTAFEVLQRGSVGVDGSTAAVLGRSLQKMKVLLDPQRGLTAPAD